MARPHLGVKSLCNLQSATNSYKFYAIILLLTVACRVGLGLVRIVLRVAFLAGGGFVLYRTQHSSLSHISNKHPTVIAVHPELNATTAFPVLLTPSMNEPLAQEYLSLSPQSNQNLHETLFESLLPFSLRSAHINPNNTARTTSKTHFRDTLVINDNMPTVTSLGMEMDQKAGQSRLTAEITLQERARVDAYLWSWLPTVYVSTVAVLGKKSIL